MTIADILIAGYVGLRAKLGRSVLTALGIAIGVASIFAVLGISASSRADVLRQLDRLGTNVLAVQTGSASLAGAGSNLPEEATNRLKRIPATINASSIVNVDVDILRSDLMAAGRNGGIQVSATDSDLVATLSGTMETGRNLTPADAQLPVVVLGSEAAKRLGIRTVGNRQTVSIDGYPFLVVGILDEFGLYPDVDRTALIGLDVADNLFAASRNPDLVYVQADPNYVEPVSAVLARTVNPNDPGQVKITRPSVALEAKTARDQFINQTASWARDRRPSGRRAGHRQRHGHRSRRTENRNWCSKGTRGQKGSHRGPVRC